MKVGMYCPLPGTLALTHVEDGDRVEFGDKICEIECMKVFTTIIADVPGVVTFNFELGEVVGQNDILLTLETSDG